jgi:ribosomal protein S27E
MLCPDCNNDKDHSGLDGYCDICNRRIIKRSWGKKLAFGFFDWLKLHRHNFEPIETLRMKNRHGEFNVILMKCSKCPQRTWIVSGFIEQVEEFEHELESRNK